MIYKSHTCLILIITLSISLGAPSVQYAMENSTVPPTNQSYAWLAGSFVISAIITDYIYSNIQHYQIYNLKKDIKYPLVKRITVDVLGGIAGTTGSYVAEQLITHNQRIADTNDASKVKTSIVLPASAEQVKNMTPFQLLRLSESASQKDIEQAYKRLSLRLHPDKRRDCTKEHATEIFQEFQKKYDSINTPAKRQEFFASKITNYDDDDDDEVTIFDVIQHFRNYYQKFKQTEEPPLQSSSEYE